MSCRLLVAGGAGFSGSNFARYWLERHPDDHVPAFAAAPAGATGVI
jgi:dTDP-D-glucose 4,6-dehydratase